MLRTCLVFALLYVSINAIALEQQASDHARISVNPDGTATLADPGFQLDGVNHWLSSESNISGVCKLFGFGDSLPSTLKVSNAAFNVLLVNAEGQYTGLARGLSIISVSCEVHATKLEFEATANPDGSVTYSDLRIGNSFFTRRISFQSDVYGLCRRLGSNGFTAAAAGTGYKDGQSNFVLDERGSIMALDRGEYIEAITCKIQNPILSH